MMTFPLPLQQETSHTSALPQTKNYQHRKTKLKWKDIFENNTREEKVATFLAVLELIKNKRISIDDDNSEMSS